MQGGQWRGRRRRTRFRRFRWGQGVLIAVFAALLTFGLVKLIGYGMDLAASRQTAEALRQVYQQETEAPESADTPSPQPTAAASPAAAPSPTATPAVSLPAVPYPDNPKLQISSRFKALCRENRDIVGWLTLESLLDEAVVQRDESYYMDHDALGKKNVNGAIFLDSAVSLKTRPYTYILYGHNMKTGAMFGCLRNYENASFYHKNPFITFDTMYETGRYVIFAVGTVNIAERVRNYMDLFALRSANVLERQNALDTLVKLSVFTNFVDVQPGDQVLLLVTCVDNDNERRIVAARRVREGEDEADLKKLVDKSWKK